MLWSLHNEDWDRDSFAAMTERYDLDGLKGMTELKEKGLIHYSPTDLEAWPILSGSGKESEWSAVFNQFRTAYPQKQGKRGNEVEFDAFKKACKKHKMKWQEEILKLYPAVIAEIRYRKNMAARGRDEGTWAWPMLSTYLNQARWTAEYIAEEIKAGSEIYQKYLDWVSNTFTSTPDAQDQALSESQYNDLRNMTGALSIFRGKVSEQKVKAKMVEGHQLFFGNNGKISIFETIIEILKK